ncbi:MAG TPA: DUF998 domain-containing protein [Candidatus Saccharimonadales bacterium]|nr:DUF998 domain-containing protein [Candidatus Saccharimonadales bacterium]
MGINLYSRQFYAEKVVIFRDRHPLVGPIFWLLSVQYFLTQIFVAGAWSAPFSLRTNAISDLGNTDCGTFAHRLVCSPLHDWMNASFIVLGITMVVGSFLIPSEFRKNMLSRVGFYGMALAGLGTVLVGMFPENTVGYMHVLGAALPFFVGNSTLVLFSYSLSLPPGFRYYTRASGLVALAALAVFLYGQYFGLGLGGTERLIAYPQTIWLIAFGWYMSLDHYRQTKGHKITYS